MVDTKKIEKELKRIKKSQKKRERGSLELKNLYKKKFLVFRKAKKKKKT